MPALSLAMVLAMAPIALDGDDPSIDLAAARAGIEARIGDAADDWRVSIDTASDGRVGVHVLAPDGARFDRVVAVESGDPVARGRQVATAVALLIGEHRPAATDEPDRDADRPDRRPPARGWLAAGPHVSSGASPAPDPAFGVALSGGAWLAGGVVQPIGGIRWQRSRAGALVVDGIVLAGGAAFGAALARDRLWLGGGVLAGAVAGVARDRVRASGWSADLGVPAVVQLRLRAVLVHLDVGPELTLPPLRFVGADTQARWGHVRVHASLQIGVVMGRRRHVGSRRAGPV